MNKEVKIMIVGATGTGKTTVAAACMRGLHESGFNDITLKDFDTSDVDFAIKYSSLKDKPEYVKDIKVTLEEVQTQRQ